MLHVVGAACSAGGQGRGCYFAPEYVEAALLFSKSPLAQVEFSGTVFEADLSNSVTKDMAFRAGVVSQFTQKLHDSLLALPKNDKLPLRELPMIVGGDHSCAMGSWRAIAKHREPIGMLWIDAHLDCHTPLTSFSGALHGMPLAYLLGYEGFNQPVDNSESIIDPKYTVVFGVRSYENEELQHLKDKGVRVIFMDEIGPDTFLEQFKYALEHVASCSAGFGLSLDLDAFDPSEVPGVSVAVNNGLHLRDFFDTFVSLSKSPYWKQLLAVEIAEFNPEKDVDEKTLNFVLKLISVFSVLTQV